MGKGRVEKRTYLQEKQNILLLLIKYVGNEAADNQLFLQYQCNGHLYQRSSHKRNSKASTT